MNGTRNCQERSNLVMMIDFPRSIMYYFTTHAFFKKKTRSVYNQESNFSK